MSEEKWPFGWRLKLLRRSRGMSAQSLADAAGAPITRAVLANIESGRSADLTISKLLALSKALGVKPAVIDPRIDPAAAQKVAEASANLEQARAALDQTVTS